MPPVTCQSIAASALVVWSFAFASFAFADDGPIPNYAAAMKLLRSSCGDCHGEEAEGGFSVAQIESEDSLKNQFERWQKIRTRLVDRSMPPSDSEPLKDTTRESLTSWIQSATLAAVCEDGPTPGPPALRRLTRHEYSNTIRDLLDIHFDAGQGLPDEAAGGEGFTNAAETLTISPLHAEQFLQAAIDALDYASRDQRARRKLLGVRPVGDRSEDDAARQNLAQLARRAFRRDVTDQQLERYVELYRGSRQDGESFDQAVLYGMRGILVSPSFLFINESRPQETGVAERVTDHELAVRLSYFLWATTPDEALRRAADAGTLNDDKELEKQTLRMLRSRGTHLQDSMEQFMGSWLGTADLGRSKHVDRTRHPWVEDPHVAALRNQPVYAMESILKRNESILELIDADWTFLNNELVRVYRLRRNKIEGKFVQRLVRVKLPDEYAYRGGLLGMGGVMAVSSYPRRSSPVLRGSWVLEKMLGVELPPPPPDVPAFDESQKAEEAKTLRERLEQHRQDATCATCHDRIDPIGFALESFDELGRWREKDAGGKIDTTATLLDGTKIQGVAGLKRHLLERKETFARVVTRKMLGYALGRSLRPSDLCTIESIVKRLKENDYRSHELVLGIVMSVPFRQKLKEKAQ